MKWDNDTIASELGVDDKPIKAPGIVRYVAGCIKRERERLARIIEAGVDPKEIAAAIRDESEDPSVFQWKGP